MRTHKQSENLPRGLRPRFTLRKTLARAIDVIANERRSSINRFNSCAKKKRVLQARFSLTSFRPLPKKTNSDRTGEADRYDSMDRCVLTRPRLT